MSTPSSPPLSSLSSLQSSDRLGSSPHILPAVFPSTAKPSSSFGNPCSIPGCTVSTTSPPLPALFLSLAALCFAPTAAGVVDFSGKVAVYLCAGHRRRLEEYRQLALGHAAHSIDVWSDSMHDQHTARNSASLQTLTLEASPASSAADPLLPAASAGPAAHAPSVSYRTFPSSLTAASALLSTAADGAFTKRPLSCTARVALAGGWLLVASFVSLWAAFSLLHLMRG